MLRSTSRLWLLALLLTVANVVSTAAAQTGPSFTEHVAPLLVKYCAGCHNTQDAEAELALETYAALQRGGASGPVVVPGRVNESKLIRVLTGADEMRMPPEDEPQPTAAEVALLRLWVERGAQPPRKPAEDQPGRVVSEPLHDSTAITALAASPDGSQYAVGRYQRVEIFESASGTLLQVLRGLPGKVTAIHFSHDGARLVTASGVTGQSGSATLWDLATAQRLHEFAGHRDILYDAELSPDGLLLASCSYDRRIVLWDTASGEQLRVLDGHNDAVYDLAFDPQGQVLASASGDETVKLWHVASGLRLDTLSQPQAEQYTVDFSPDGRFVVAGGADNRIRMWHFVSKEKQRINPIAFARFAHEGAVVGVAFSQDGRYLVSAAADRSLKQWETKTLEQVHRFVEQPDLTTGLAILPQSGELLAAGIDGTLGRYALATAGKVVSQHQQVPTASAPIDAESTNRVAEHEPNDRVENAMRVFLPARIEGSIATHSDASEDQDLFRFESRQGQQWILEVVAARDDSPLDSQLEVLDAEGNPIERVLLQAVRDSYFTFRGKDSAVSDDFRLHNWQEMELNEYLYANGEVVKLWHYPRGPDSGFQVYPGSGERYAYFDTTAISHALHEPCYIVEPRKPGTAAVSNGLPAFTLYYENDDDGRREVGADSRLTFEAPHDGEFLARVIDVRGFGGPDYRYQLIVRPRQQDFQASLAGKDPSLSRGSGKEFAVTVARIDGFDGEIHLDVQGLPPGFHASTPLVVEAGQDTALGTLYAERDAEPPSSEAAAGATIVASAVIEGETVRKDPISLGKIELLEESQLITRIVPADSQPDWTSDEPWELSIQPGETITAKVRIERNGFEGRVGFGKADAGRNLPHGVYVDNIGLNGLLIVEGQDERTFFITAADFVPETTRLFHLRTESEGNVTSRPVLLRVARD